MNEFKRVIENLRKLGRETIGRRLEDMKNNEFHHDDILNGILKNWSIINLNECVLRFFFKLSKNSIKKRAKN